MAELIGGFATSHATAFMKPELWDAFRIKMRGMYQERYGDLPDEQPQVSQETLEDIELRYARIEEAHELIRLRIRELRPDAVIVLGNDQNENYAEQGVPQFAIFTGNEAIVDDWLSGTKESYTFGGEIAYAVLEGLVEQGFDVTQTTRFADGTLKAHAHAQVFANLMPEADIPVIPIFVNAITPPQASVGRCFNFGSALRKAIEARMPGKRVMIGVSGGLSHFTVGYPYKSLKVKRDIGTIRPEFDHKLIGWMNAGELHHMAELTDEDLLNSGNVEFRQGLAFLGALPPGSVPERLEYEVFYRGFMGFWAGYWSL